MKIKKYSFFNAAVGGIVLASLSTIAIMRYNSFRNLKKDIDSIPYDVEKPFNWRYFFKNY